MTNQPHAKSIKRQIQKIGITSVYSGGKGTVCSFLEQMGAYIIDFDILARQVVFPGSPALIAIADHFGPQVISSDGSLNRPKLAAMVFSNAQLLTALNHIIHPQTIHLAQIIMQEITAKQPETIFALNIPLLFEAKLQYWVDYIVVINTPQSEVLRRGQRRDGLSSEEILSRLEHQIPLNEKLPLADYIIDNSGSITDTKKQVEKLWQTIRTSC